jgi:hypothetical protein
LSKLGKEKEALQFLTTRSQLKFGDNSILGCNISRKLSLSNESKQQLFSKFLPSEFAMFIFDVNKAMVLILNDDINKAEKLLENLKIKNANFLPTLQCLFYVYLKQDKLNQALELIKCNCFGLIY